MANFSWNTLKCCSETFWCHSISRKYPLKYYKAIISIFPFRMPISSLSPEIQNAFARFRIFIIVIALAKTGEKEQTFVVSYMFLKMNGLLWDYCVCLCFMYVTFTIWASIVCCYGMMHWVILLGVNPLLRMNSSIICYCCLVGNAKAVIRCNEISALSKYMLTDVEEGSLPPNEMSRLLCMTGKCEEPGIRYTKLCIFTITDWYWLKFQSSAFHKIHRNYRTLSFQKQENLTQIFTSTRSGSSASGGSWMLLA